MVFYPAGILADLATRTWSGVLRMGSLTPTR